MLRELANNLWTYSTSFQSLGFDIGVRCNIVRFARGNLLIHSPLQLTQEFGRSLTKLGSVRYIVAPNSHHHLFVSEFAKKYPQAELWVVPQVIKKQPHLPHAHILGDATAMFVGNEMKLEVVTGRSFFTEAVFLHVPSKTLVLTDLISNMPMGEGLRGFLQSKVFGAGKGPKPGRFIRLALGQSEATRAAIGRIVKMDFSRIVMAHGEIIEKDAKKVMADAFGYLLPSFERP